MAVPSAAGGTGESQRWPRARRLTRSRDIRAVLKRGKRSRTAHLDVIASPSPEPHPRVGVLVPRHRRTVVERNRLKRRLREIVRRDVLAPLSDIDHPVDVLVRARAEAYESDFRALREELLEAFRRRWPRGFSFG